MGIAEEAKKGLAELKKEEAKERKILSFADFEYESYIVGINYSNFPYPFGIIFDLYSYKHPIILEKEPNNLYDKFALKCNIGNERFGYIKRRDEWGRDIHSKNVSLYLDKYHGYIVRLLSSKLDYDDPDNIDQLDIKIYFYKKNNWSKIKIDKPKIDIEKILDFYYPKEKIPKNAILDRPEINKNSINTSKLVESEKPQNNFEKLGKNEMPNFKVNESINKKKSSRTPKNKGMGFLYWFLFWDFIIVGLIGLFNINTLSTVPFLIFIIVGFGIPFIMYKFTKSKK